MSIQRKVLKAHGQVSDSQGLRRQEATATGLDVSGLRSPAPEGSSSLPRAEASGLAPCPRLARAGAAGLGPGLAPHGALGPAAAPFAAWVGTESSGWEAGLGDRQSPCSCNWAPPVLFVTEPRPRAPFLGTVSLLGFLLRASVPSRDRSAVAEIQCLPGGLMVTCCQPCPVGCRSSPSLLPVPRDSWGHHWPGSSPGGLLDL